LTRRRSDISEIGYWSEVKLDIIKDYAAAYSRILAAQARPPLTHIYIDAFSGAGFHKARGSGELVWGSPANALALSPPFKEYHFIDLDQGNIDTLRTLIQSRPSGPYDPQSVYLYNADCNDILIENIFPRVRYEDYRRGLCLLDPYGLHLDWRVIEAAGRMRSIEIFLNFPILDMNRNVLRHNLAKVDPSQIARMNRFWGDESWREAAYTTQENFFGFEEKTANETMVEAFRRRMREVAGFAYVSDGMPMRNSTGATLYYLLFASQKPVARKIVSDIFKRHADRRK